MSPRSVAIVRIWPRAEMTARRPDGEMSNELTSLLTRLDVDLVLFLVGRDIELDLGRLAGRDVELPDSEVVLVHDHLAIARHRRPEQAAIGVPRDLNRLAALHRNLVDVVDARTNLRGARLHALVVRQRVGDEIDRIVCAPHRPVAVVALVAKELRIRLATEVGDPQIRGVAAAVVLSRPDRWVAIEHHAFAVRRETGPVSPIHGQRLLLPTADGNLVQRRDGWEGAVASRGTEDDALRVARPSDDLVVARVVRQPAGRAAGGRDDEHVVVAVPVGREGNPTPIRRKPRVDFARAIVREPMEVRAVLGGRPDVAQIAEGDRACAIVRMACQPYRCGVHRRHADGQDQKTAEENTTRHFADHTLLPHQST